MDLTTKRGLDYMLSLGYMAGNPVIHCPRPVCSNHPPIP
jgi:hypothetical protein